MRRIDPPHPPPVDVPLWECTQLVSTVLVLLIQRHLDSQVVHNMTGQQKINECPEGHLTLRERCKVAATAFAFFVAFSGVFAVIVIFGEPLRELKDYPLEPRGWFIVERNGAVVREANLWDMVKAKYSTLLFLGGYIACSAFAGYVFVVGVLGRRNAVTRFVLTELGRQSFKLSN